MEIPTTSHTAIKKKVRWSTGVFFFLSGIVITTWTSRIPEFQQKFGLSNVELGWVLFSINIGLVLGLPFSGWFIARFTSSRIMVIGAIIYSALLPFIAFTTQLWLLVVLLFLFGGIRTFLSMSSNTKAIEIQQLYSRPVIAKFHGAWSLACLIGVGIGAIMISRTVAPIIHFSIITLLVIILVLIFRRRKRSTVKPPDERPFFVMPDKYLLIIGLIIFCSMSCESAMFDWSINYYDKVIHASKNVVALGYTCFIIMFTLGRLVGDGLIERFGPIPMLAFNGLLMASGFLVAIIFPGVFTSAIGFLMVGFGGSIVVPLGYSLAGKSKAMLPGYAIVSVTMIGYGGFLTCPLIMGFLTEKWGMQSAFGLMAVYALGVSGLAVWLKKHNAN